MGHLVFFLQKNALESISLAETSSLMWLDISHNNLNSIHGLEGCQNLRHLNLSHNRITRIGESNFDESYHLYVLSLNSELKS